MIIDNCQLEYDEDRGVLYVHSSEGRTVLRICGLPQESAEFMDITLKGQKLAPYTFSWRPLEILTKYFLRHDSIGEKEVTKEQFIKAERSAGFHPKCASDDPEYWTRLATGGFTSGGVHGRIEYEEVDLAGRNPCKEIFIPGYHD